VKNRILNTATKNSNIYLNKGIGDLDNLAKGKRIAVITDENVKKLYGSRFPNADFVYTVAPGEKSKSLQTVDNIYQALLENEYDRSSIIIGIGGGVVTDLAGFVASTYMRGIDFGFAATTLLAQVDAAIGGKNGVNLKSYKNVVGTINQPSFVVIDTKSLTTLPKNELANGLSELVKAAVIGNLELFDFLEKNHKSILNLDFELLTKAIGDAIEVKANIVEQDERELGTRRLLNLGHTFGHAIERVEGTAHGKAVAIGMTMASKLSVKLGFMNESEMARIKNLLEHFGLSTQTRASTFDIMDAIRKDKKRNREIIHFVVPKNIGTAICKDLSFVQIEEALSDLR